jgi:release factor glutamine methyltransferase
VTHPAPTVSARLAALSALRAAGCVFAEDELAALLEAAPDDATLATLVERRATGEPLEQVVGYADFCGVRIRLRPGVFVPRPRTALLVHTAAALATPASTVLDLCCGSGALGAALAARVPGITLHAADNDPTAVACARDNLHPYRGHVHQGDLFAPVPQALQGRLDLILANVPYVPTPDLPLLPAEARLYEPPTALDGGPDGLAVFRRVVAAAPHWLAPNGRLLSEVAEHQTRAAVTALSAAHLDAETTRDPDLGATVVIGHRRP